MDLSDITAAMRLNAAEDAGWERIGQRFVPAANETYVRWRKLNPDAVGLERQAPDSELKPPGLREALRADDIGFFAGACPVCDAPLRWIPPDEEFDFGLVTVYPELQVMSVAIEDLEAVANVGPEQLSGFGIEHDAECPVRPESIFSMVEAAAN